MFQSENPFNLPEYIMRHYLDYVIDYSIRILEFIFVHVIHLLICMYIFTYQSLFTPVYAPIGNVGSHKDLVLSHVSCMMF